MRSLSLFSTALLAGLLLLPAQSLAQDDPVYDLDMLNAQQLDGLLNAEIDDIFEQLDQNASYSVEEVAGAIMYALSDEGDNGNENYIDFDELEAEMAEIDSSVADEVYAAVSEADDYAARPGVQPASVPGVHLIGDDQVMPRVAFGRVKGRLTSGIRRGR